MAITLKVFMYKEVGTRLNKSTLGKTSIINTITKYFLIARFVASLSHTAYYPFKNLKMNGGTM